MPNNATTIVAQPVSVDKTEALGRARKPERRSKQIKHNLAGVIFDDVTLCYKPFYVFNVELDAPGTLKKGGAKSGCIIVDAVTGIARARPDGYTDLEEVTTDPTSLVARELTRNDALEAAKAFKVKLEHRESREAEMDHTGTEVFKPVWIVTCDSDNRCIVDAVNGETFSDISFRQIFTERLLSIAN